MAFIALSGVSLLNKADKKIADGTSILADSWIKFLNITILKISFQGLSNQTQDAIKIKT